MGKIKTAFTKFINLFLVFLVALSSLVSCAPKPAEVFKTEAKEWLSDFSDSQSAVKPQTIYEYGENGSFAAALPKISIVDADRAVSEYYELLKNEFYLRAQTDADKLLISYKAYKASNDITGVEIISEQTLNGDVSRNVKTFNFDTQGLIAADDVLTKLTLINVKDILSADEQYKSVIDKKKLSDRNNYQMLFTDVGISVIYSSGAVAPKQSGEIRVQVPYAKLRYALPESIKSDIPEDESVRTVDITKKLVALTFDDGPTKTYTGEILDTLEAYDSVATFFDVGTMMTNGAETMKRAAALGCEMGSHSYSHKNLKTSSAEVIKEELSKADALYEEILGSKPTLLRPPFGAVGTNLKENCDKYLIGWSVDTLDWKYRDAQKVIENVKKEGNLDGDVILMHALYKSTADAVKELVPWLIENGYQLVTVSELMKYRYDTEMETGVYYSTDFFESNK